jgi:hypothetical protein
VKALGEGLGYEELVQYYNFRHRAVNEGNGKRPFLAFCLTSHRHYVL